MGEESNKGGMSRLDFLKMSAVAGVGLIVGGAGMKVIERATGSDRNKAVDGNIEGEQVEMYGEHQAGIVTPQQTYMYLASFKIVAADLAAVIRLMKDWTKFSDLSTSGGSMRTGDNPMLPPSDTGETYDLPASGLTVTFGFGPSLFGVGGGDRYGLAGKLPIYLKDIPRMPREKLDATMSGGDVIVQVCADDQQVAFHAIRNFIRLSTGAATLNWLNEGFISGRPGTTPRNLFGFKDGTANVLHQTSAGFDQVVWAGEDEPEWMRGGTYMAFRKIRMLLEVWDRSSMAEQQDTFGRYKESGAAYGKQGEFDEVDASKLPDTAHVRLAKESKQLIHRRGYSYTDGVDPRTGNVNAGLLFISYQRNPEEQFIPMLKLMQSNDKLNEYTLHIASGMFACPGGIRQGEYIGQKLFES
ncbi:iron uptake transporter deferrochelatase/peroxidase subunit [Cohnella panacarvi]|uniref:iron uptake transporter deferrochelatase/peroxidase subunit n=1 Tax=Cohnella panacarvi TaxID=400776 RepID=UPI00054EA9BF|nr:iron uptake transporter deferrochelatase/peroxidase subunit [Cohnella panacarvi]